MSCVALKNLQYITRLRYIVWYEIKSLRFIVFLEGGGGGGGDIN